MILVIDVGNTHSVVGVYQDADLHASWRVTSRASRTTDELGILIKQLFQDQGLDPSAIQHIVIGSVVPHLTTIFHDMAVTYFNIRPLLVDAYTDTGVEICYDDPGAVGADRIANAVAAYELFGGPIIVVDFGTATTFDVISDRGQYLGGIICPGVETSAAELVQRAARLLSFEIKEPPCVIGRNTQTCLQSGLFYGTLGQVEGIIHWIWQELGRQTRVVATGGLAPLIAPRSELIERVEPLLTLEGLRRICLRALRT